ncbi:hypothetical protein KC19_1G088900 [Ceratodon purpureus]|uniref:Uncharacterized protein n=1 Tax=Ceratodon purpureus TaxID=3225 RepID=A0A8T0J679_CERPU|nr:hypothetical protein KC19_1G088900 [Ceratodon purpureus]
MAVAKTLEPSQGFSAASPSPQVTGFRSAPARNSSLPCRRVLARPLPLQCLRQAFAFHMHRHFKVSFK